MGDMTSIDMSALTAGHRARLASADPLLPVPALPRPAAGDELIGAEVGESVAVGVARLVAPDPDSLGATWGALRQHELVVQVSGRAPAPALDALLAEWDRLLARTAAPGDPDTAAVVTWPSHDTAPAVALTRHGFAPLLVCAARPAGRPEPRLPGTGIRIRPATDADLDVATELNLDVIDYDAQFGMVTRRPGTRAAVRAGLAEILRRDRTAAWLAERGGEAIGLLAIDLPPYADWIASRVAAAPVGYLGCLVVRAGARSAGVGSTLVAEGHRVLDAAGVAVTLLHHALPNPTSTPFWYSHGYRPLWTYWQRRPAVS
jgi:GNAT superfamily N-acetyltransferase